MGWNNLLALVLLLVIFDVYGFRYSTPYRLSKFSISAQLSYSQSFASSSNFPGSAQHKYEIIAVVNGTSHFHTKPFHEPILWIEVFQKLQEKLIYEKFNNKYSAINDNNHAINMLIVNLEDMINDHVPIGHYNYVFDKNEYKNTTNINFNIDEVSIDNIRSNILVLVGAESENATYLSRLFALSKHADAIAVFNSSESIHTRLSKFGNDNNPQSTSIISRVNNFLSSKIQQKSDKADRGKKQKLAAAVVKDLFNRKSLEDLLFMLLVLVDAFPSANTNKEGEEMQSPLFDVDSVRSVTSTENTSFKQIFKMCKNCWKEMLDCLSDEQCRKALNCLNNCKGNDQVCSYKCITSYESEKFERFAYCILQKHNCMGNKASIPIYPNPPPLTSFRGKQLDHLTAENIFIGHLKTPTSNPLLSDDAPRFPWSWKVICGQNPAYDYFNCQHQIFYRSIDHMDYQEPIDDSPSKPRAEKLYYDPVFKVINFNNEEIWRRRHYSVRRGKLPGQFYFWVQDNGVVSSEFWRILDCAEDLSWAVFYYSGAAAAAGTSYTGSLIVSPDGNWPEMTVATRERIDRALARGKVSNWELFEVNNTYSHADFTVNRPPLGTDGKVSIV